MNYKRYKKLHDFLSTAKVLCTLAAVLYVLYWFLDLLNFPYLKYVSIIFAPPIVLLKTVVRWNMTYDERVIDMLPLVVAGLLQIMHFVFNYFVSVTEKMEEKYKLNKIAEKKLEEKLMNENLKEIFKNKTMQYTKFAILLTLDLKPAVDPNIAASDVNFKEIASKEYAKIVTLMRKKYATCKAITPGKLFIVYNNFALFDDFFTDILKKVKEISTLNKEKQITTNFTFVVDALREDDNVSKVLDLLEKISTFNYTNKAVATSSFNIRYKLNAKQNKYNLETMGISRFFEQNSANPQKSVDFELFSMKASKKQAIN